MQNARAWYSNRGAIARHKRLGNSTPVAQYLVKAMTSRGDFTGQSSAAYTGGKRKVSDALWCDKGEHAFSSKDQERQHFAQTQTVPVQTGNSYGSPTYQDRMQITEEIDICGPCWKSGGVMAEKAIPAGPTLDEMQQYNDDWQAGYNAAIDHLASGQRP